jgi:hypothetical protein
MSLVGVIQDEVCQWAKSGAKDLAAIVGIMFSE